MATMLTKTSAADPYLQLVRSFPLRPIRTRTAHQQAKAVLRSLVGARGAAARDYKVVLASLISDYERSANLRMDTSKVTAADVVQHLLGEQGMSVNALAKKVAIPQSSLSEMLSGRREWSKLAIVRVAGYFKLRTDLFLK
jgi:HTH-type transcriptional regulator/antitoxin HigA